MNGTTTTIPCEKTAVPMLSSCRYGLISPHGTCWRNCYKQTIAYKGEFLAYEEETEHNIVRYMDCADGKSGFISTLCEDGWAKVKEYTCGDNCRGGKIILT